MQIHYPSHSAVTDATHNCTVGREEMLMKPYRLQLLQALSNNDKVDHSTFGANLLDTSDHENLMSKVVFCNQETFHLSGKVNTHNCHIWTLQNPRSAAGFKRDTPK
jgi:hypothetical protein